MMSWFGEVDDGIWKMDVKTTVKEVGLGILRAYKVSLQPVAQTGIDLALPLSLDPIRMTQYPRTSSSRNGGRPSETLSSQYPA